MKKIMMGIIALLILLLAYAQATKITCHKFQHEGQPVDACYIDGEWKFYKPNTLYTNELSRKSFKERKQSRDAIEVLKRLNTEGRGAQPATLGGYLSQQLLTPTVSAKATAKSKAKAINTGGK